MGGGWRSQVERRE